MDGIVGMAATMSLVGVLYVRPEMLRPGRGRTYLLGPRKERDSIPKTDRHVMLSYASSARFGRIQPPGAPPPGDAEVPFVGPSPYAVVDGSTNTKADVPQVVVTLNGRQSAGSWLFGTGAFVVFETAAATLELRFKPEAAKSGRKRSPGVGLEERQSSEELKP